MAAIVAAALEGASTASRVDDYQLKPPAWAGRIVPEPCPRSSGNEIVVCGRAADRYRLKEPVPPKGMEVDAPDGSFGLGLAKGVRLEAETVVRPDGFIDRRVLVKVKVPF